MMFVPRSDVTYLRDNCRDDSRFPNPYDATDEQLESVPYLAEIAWDENFNYVSQRDGESFIVTFDEIRDFFNDWKASGEMDEDYPPDFTVYEWIRDCIDNGLHPVTVKGE